MNIQDLEILKEKINRIIELAQRLREENSELRENNSRLLVEIGKLQRQNKRINEDLVNEMKHTRTSIPSEQIEELKNKIRIILSKLEKD